MAINSSMSQYNSSDDISIPNSSTSDQQLKRKHDSTNTGDNPEDSTNNADITSTPHNTNTETTEPFSETSNIGFESTFDGDSAILLSELMSEDSSPLIDGPIYGTEGTSIYVPKVVVEGSTPESMMVTAVSNAIQVGFRIFDCGERYANQEEVGRALRESNIPREQFTVIGKVDGMLVGDYDDMKERMNNMLEALGLEYVDVLLVHYPLKSGSDLLEVPSQLVTEASWAYFKENIGVAWKHMTNLKNDGLTKKVGVSNFYENHLMELLKIVQNDITLAPVAVNEVFIDAAHPEFELASYCQNNSIQCIAYRPLKFLPVYSFVNGLNDKLQEACSQYSVANPHQLVLRWLKSRGICAITSSTNREHMADNFAASSSSNTDQQGAEEGNSGNSALIDLSFISDQVETVDMYGGVDEYAVAFKGMGTGAGASEEVMNDGMKDCE
jgi:diketogulonate reductase-like aldo/keto reductase